jgi:hypothetical protein
MAKMLRFAIFSILIFTAGRAFASGGACPASPYYATTAVQSPATLSRPSVTLASLGITNCFYISAAGADTNSGTTESSPWLHAPGMPSCTANCAVVTPGPGTGFIFRGGDTWHFGASTSPSTGGTWSFSWNGSSGNPIDIDVDLTWYSGSSWARPILTGDNPLCGPSNVGGACSQGAYGSYTVKQYYLSSCSHQIGSGNNMLNFSGSSHYILNNFEITGLCQNDAGQPNGTDQYISYGSSADMQFLNLYVHGWSHVRFVDLNGGSGCGTGVCANMRVFSGGGGTAPDDVIHYDVIDGSDSDPVAMTGCYCDFWDVAYSYIGNQSQVITRYQHLFHDNLYEYWYENGHGNVMESVSDAPGTNAVYNNVFRHINTTNDPGDPMFWPFPPPGTSDYWFNNLSYDVTNMEYFNIGQNAPQTSGQGPIVFFNNTFQYNTNASIFGCSSPYPFSWTAANNHYVTDDSSVYGSSACTTGSNSDTTSLTMTNATATMNGYTSSQTYAYSPTSSSSPTAGKGTNKQSYCTALSAAGLSGAATACQSDTAFACSYDSTKHAVVCPQRTKFARPGSGNAAWSVGAYQSGLSPNAPVNLQGTVP